MKVPFKTLYRYNDFSGESARSLTNKLNKFQSYVYSKAYDIVCITETWLNEMINDNEILPENYTIYRNDRGTRGGGVLIAVNSNIPSKLITRHINTEMITIELDLSPKLQISCLYIPPNCSVEYQQFLLRTIHTLPTQDDVILLGDFNAPDANWSTFSANSAFSTSLCDALLSQNFMQMVSQPTHKKGNTLDLILTNAPFRLGNICVVRRERFLQSDHYPVTADLYSTSTSQSHLNTKPNEPAQLNYADLPKLSLHLSLCIESDAYITSLLATHQCLGMILRM